MGHLGSMRLLIGALLLAAVIVLAIAAFEAGGASPTPSSGQAHGVVWAGQTFATRADFVLWLRSHGTTYRAWAQRHAVDADLTSNQKHSVWSPGVLAGISAVLVALAAGLAFTRRRWPASGAAAAHLVGVMGLASAAAIGAGARTAGHWAALSARRSKPHATAAARGAAHRLELVARKGAATAGAGARTTRHWAALPAQRSTAVPAATAFSDRRRRSELTWYVTSALLAAGIGVVVTLWLNGV